MVSIEDLRVEVWVMAAGFYIFCSARLHLFEDFFFFTIITNCFQTVIYWWPILRICALHLTVNTHTHREHTPGEVGSHLCCGPRGAVGGSVSFSRAHQSWYWRWRERCTFTPPHPTYNSSQTWDSNLQPLDYESDSLTIRSWLPYISRQNIAIISSI